MEEAFEQKDCTFVRAYKTEEGADVYEWKDPDGVYFGIIINKESGGSMVFTDVAPSEPMGNVSDLVPSDKDLKTLLAQAHGYLVKSFDRRRWKAAKNG